MGERLFYGVLNGIKKGFNHLIDSAKMVFVCCLLMSVLTLVNTTRDISMCTDMYTRLQRDFSTLSKQYRTIFVQDGYEVAQLHAIALKDQISGTIELEYHGDYDRLKKDLSTYRDSNDVNNPLYKIFNEVSFAYIDHWFPQRHDVRIVICDRNSVLFSTREHEPLKNEVANNPILFDRPNNMVVVKSSLGDPCYAGSLSSVSADVDKLDMVELIASSYIYEHKDLLGTPDVMPNGDSSNNYKLAILVVYKPVDTNSMYILKKVDSEVRDSMTSNYAGVISLGLRTFIIWFALTLLFGCIAFKNGPISQ